MRAFIGGVDQSFRPAGGLLAPAIVVGAIVMWRRGMRRETMLLALPIGLTMLAAWLHAFPFDSRVILFATAPLALLAGEGMASFLRQAHIALAADPATMKRVFWGRRERL